MPSTSPCSERAAGGDDWREAASAGTAAVALLSGGLDSGVAMAAWLEQGGRIELALTADYGQRAAANERTAAAALAAGFAVPWRSLDLRWLSEPGLHAGSALLAGGAELPQRSAGVPGDAASAHAVWVPARNVVLCAVAAAFADATATGALLTGFNAEEAQTFPDNSRAFATAFTAALAYGCRTRVRVLSPTQDLDKAAIAATAWRLGLRPQQFWSCYDGGPRPCGSCESCARSARAWTAAGGKT